MIKTGMQTVQELIINLSNYKRGQKQRKADITELFHLRSTDDDELLAKRLKQASGKET